MVIGSSANTIISQPAITYFTPCSSVSIVNFEHVIAGWDTSLKNERYKRSGRYKNDTTQHNPYMLFWDFKNSTKEIPILQWSVFQVVKTSSHILKRCLLCLNENVLIAT